MAAGTLLKTILIALGSHAARERFVAAAHAVAAPILPALALHLFPDTFVDNESPSMPPVR
jgi:hypothetical protein